MKRISFGNSFLIVIGFLALYIQPIYLNYPIYYDSGVFSYVGSIINHGKLPYLDAWDHKGLWIYFYNAIGLRLWNGEVRGIYILEYLLTVSSLFIALKLLINTVNFRKNIIQTSLIGLIGSYALFFEGGNLPETIVFPWQMIFYTLAFYVINCGDNLKKKALFILAVIAAISIATAILTRPNNALGILLLTLFLFYKEGRYFKKYLFIFQILVFIPVTYYVISNGLLFEMKTNYIDYNFYYSHMDFYSRIKNSIFFTSVLFLSPLGLVLISRVIAFIVLNSISTWKKSKFISIIKNKNFIFFIIFVVDFLSQMVSGRVGSGYLHYSIIIIPSLFILTIIVGSLNGEVISNARWMVNKDIFYKSAIVLFSMLFVIRFNYTAYNHFYHLTDIKNEMVESIKKYSNPDDKIYVSWADAWIYVAAKRYCFTRFFYPIPVQQSAFDGRDRLAVLKDDYVKSPPKILVSWRNELFDKDVSIEYLRDNFSNNYVLAESNNYYSIYVKK